MRTYTGKYKEGQRIHKFTLAEITDRTIDYCGKSLRLARIRCDCGTEKELPLQNIGGLKSCGCLSRLEPGESLLNHCYSLWRLGSKARNIEFSLEKDQVLDMIHKPCYYCGLPPSNKVSNRTRYFGGEDVRVSGLDRVDNEKGYIPGNVVPCCGRCNSIKNAVTLHIAKKMVEFASR